METIIGTIVEATITTLVAIAVAFFGYYYKEKHHVTELVDKMYSLLREREEMFKVIVAQSAKCNSNDIAYLQLQAKHLLMEASGVKVVRLKAPQMRLFAEMCEAFFYYNDAKRYWENCMAMKYPMAEIEAEYHRRYAIFLYEKLFDYSKGEDEYKKALRLPNDNAGQCYINYSTYISWINDILVSETNILFKKELLPHNTELLDYCIRRAKSVSQGILNKKQRDDCHNEIIEISITVEERRNYLKFDK